jgi:Toprim domain-containing protein/CHC2-type zinc finger protein
VLASGRRLAYPEARLVPGKFNGTREIRFKDNARGGWADCGAWYGTFVENVVQGIARDLLAWAMRRLEQGGYPVVLHVHDEIVCEISDGFGSTDEFLQLMTQLPGWAEWVPIAAKVWTGNRYTKTGKVPGPIDGAELPISPAQVPIELSPLSVDTDDQGEDAQVPLADLIGEPLVGGKVLCPFHPDKTPSLHIFPDHFHCFVCGAHGDQLDWLTQVANLKRENALELLRSWDSPRVQAQISDEKPEKRAYALNIWRQAEPIAATLAARYLADTRCIELSALRSNIDDALRFHPRCPFGPGTRHPCLVALLRNATTHVPTGIQRIALTPDARKIDCRMLGTWGVAKLWPAGPQLVVGEGLETALAAATRVTYRSAPLQPAWAALSTGLLSKLPIIPGVQRLIILVDHDVNGAGQAAAARCADRWQRAGRTVIRLTPKRTGADFNDVVMS